MNCHLHKLFYSLYGIASISPLPSYPYTIPTPPPGDPVVALFRIVPSFPKFSGDNIYFTSYDGNEIYIFNESGKHLSTINALNGNTIFEFGYNEAGLLTVIKDEDNLTTTIERDSSGCPLAIISPHGQITTLTINSDGYLECVTNPANESMHFEYTSDGLMLSETDPMNNKHLFTHDSEGRLLKDVNPEGGFVELSREETENGFIVSSLTNSGLSKTYSTELTPSGDTQQTFIDIDGFETITLINTSGTRIIQQPNGTFIMKQLGPDPRFGMKAPLIDSLAVFLPSGNHSVLSHKRIISQLTGTEVTGLTDIIRINGNEWTSEYNGDQRLFTYTSPEGKNSVCVLDTLGRIILEAVPEIEPMEYSYNSLGQLTRISNGYRFSTFTYDSRGRVHTITDPILRTETVYYDSVGRVTKQVLPNNKEINYGYDANGNLVSIQPPGKPLHLFEYDGINQNTLYSPPDTSGIYGSTRYIFDKDKRLTNILRSDSLNIALEYDTTGNIYGTVGKLSRISTPGGFVDYEYYPETGGQIGFIMTSDGLANDFLYDGFLPVETAAMDFSDPDSVMMLGILTVEYDNNFRIITQALNYADEISYTYDNDGLLTSAGELTINNSTTNGMLTGASLNQITDSYDYNNFGEVTNYNVTIGTDTLYNLSFVLDSLGRITGKTEIVNDPSSPGGSTGQSTINYEYSFNTIGYLTKVKRNGIVTNEYVYDDNGNRTMQLMTNALMTIDSVHATYDEQDRLISYGSAQYIYTSTGNLSMKIEGIDTTHYTYDAFGNLLNVSLPNGDIIDYIVDGLNRRIEKRINGKTYRKWLYQDQLNPLAELDSNNNVVMRFVYGTKINVPDYIIKGDSTYKVITDHLGSARLIVNSESGNLAQQIEYDEYGNVLGQTGSFDIPFGFAGGLYDEQTELVRFGARDYDALTGRWTAKDPILFGGGVSNLYEYCVNDPINYLDNSGLQFVAGPESRNFYFMTNGFSNEQRNSFNKGMSEASVFVLDAGSVGSIAVGQPGLATGLSFLSTLVTSQGDNSYATTFSGTTFFYGILSKTKQAQLAFALAQLGYDFLPNGTVKPSDVNPASVADNTYVNLENLLRDINKNKTNCE